MKAEKQNATNAAPAEPIRPFCLEFDDARHEVKATIAYIARKRKIPMYLMECLLSDVCREVRERADSERSNAAAAYERQLSELKNLEKVKEDPDG